MLKILKRLKINDMKTEISKIHSTLQKDINRLRKRCILFQKVIQRKREYSLQANHFIYDMLAQGKITIEDLKPYFKKKPKII
jgi:hypothetical protein